MLLTHVAHVWNVLLRLRLRLVRCLVGLFERVEALRVWVVSVAGRVASEFVQLNCFLVCS